MAFHLLAWGAGGHPGHLGQDPRVLGDGSEVPVGDGAGAALDVVGVSWDHGSDLDLLPGELGEGGEVGGAGAEG